MVKQDSLHVELKLVEQSQKDRINLISLEFFSLVKVEIIFDEAPYFGLDLLSPSKLGYLVEVLSHYFLSSNELGVLEWKLLNLLSHLFLLHFSKFFWVRREQDVDVEREYE